MVMEDYFSSGGTSLWLAGSRYFASLSLHLRSMDPRNFSHQGAVSQLGVGSF